MKHLLYIILLFIVLSCELIKPINNEFYCKIDGKKFVPGNCDPCIPINITWDEKSGDLSIIASSKSANIIIFMKFDDKILQPRKFILTSGISNPKGIYTKKIDYKTSIDSYSETGSIEITKKSGYLISGKFDFTTNKNGVTYKITNGVFNDTPYFPGTL